MVYKNRRQCKCCILTLIGVVTLALLMAYQAAASTRDELVQDAKNACFEKRMACHKKLNHFPPQWDTEIRNRWKISDKYKDSENIEGSVKLFIQITYVGLRFDKKCKDWLEA